MQTKIYVDVLLATNYIVNTLLILCTARLTGRRPKRRRIVAAALFGSASALTIFLPFMGSAAGILAKLALAGAIVRIAFPFIGRRAFAMELFVFFAVSFFFGGVMLAVWVTLAPNGMLYHNGVVYFDVSPLGLVAATAAAYGALTLANRFARGGRVKSAIYKVEISYRGKAVSLRGLVDTGNSLYEPFGGMPVMVCRLEDIEPLLPPGAADGIRRGEHLDGDFAAYGLPVRLVPYKAVSGGGVIPAFRPDMVTLSGGDGVRRVENVCVGMSAQKVGGAGFDAVLNPDMAGIGI